MKKVLLFVAACVMSIAANAQVDITIEDFTINAGETKTIGLNLVNNEEITAYQLNMTLPAGLTVAVEDDEFVCDVERTTLKKHSLGMNLKDGVYVVLCYSQKNYAFSGTEGAVTTFDVVASSDFVGGQIKVYDKEITTPGGKQFKPAETTTNVNGATGITNIVAESLEGAKFFGADGVQTNGAQKGLNIVKTNNGVRKVMVK